MSEPVRIGPVLAETFPTCQHPRGEIRYKIIADGRKQIATQCLVCGVNTDGRWLPQAGIDMAQVRPWDNDLPAAYQRSQASVRNARIRSERLSRHLEYEHYITESEQWWEIRTKVMRRDNHWCQACLDALATEVHHKTYDHLYREVLWELEAVCHTCHQRIHNLIE
ncbi:MAG: HNH endonuclease [Planctomycetaceae bacterium]|nr:MAG: HNH endonuclease [Planctomycetaceae bacterium]